MSDNHIRYNAITKVLLQFFERSPSGHYGHNLQTLALLVNGLVACGHTHLSKLARKAPLTTKIESRLARLKRWLSNPKITPELYWQPFATVLIQKLVFERKQLTLVMDSSVVGRDCLALVIGVVYGGRSLPLAWSVVKGKKGHLPQTCHVSLLAKLTALIPKQVQITFLGDGEFDGTHLQQVLEEAGWHYVLRTAKSSQLLLSGTGKWQNYADFELKRGEQASLRGVGFSGEGYGYGRLLAVGYWDKRFDEPLYLISNLAEPTRALAAYSLRYRIETLFSDQKTRGFRLNQSHLACPERLERLLIGLALAAWWLTYLGTIANLRGWDKVLHRSERSDLSLLQLGWRLLDEWLMRRRALPTKLAQLVATHLF
jgi:hypothetical protein